MFLTKAWQGMIRLASRRGSGPQRVRRCPARRLLLESLEDRCLLSGYLVVGSYDNNSVLRYDETTGAFVDQFDPHNLGNLKTPSGGVFGPDGNLYVSSGIFQNSRQSVLKYNGTTGAFQSVFASQNVTSPRGVLFGPDGDLYVADGNDAASGDPASVERFDGKTGAFLGYFVAPGSGGLEHPSYMVFGPDGKQDGKLDLYVADTHAGSILRYDGTTGAFKGVFVSAGSGGLDAPQMMAFGSDGNLYVASGNWFNGSNGPFYSGDFPVGAVLRFEGSSGPNPGAFLGTFIAGGSGGLANPNGLLFGPDGDLYVASSVQSGHGGDLEAEPGTSEVLRYDGTTGAFLGAFVTPGSGGLRFPTFLAFTETDPTTLNYDGASPSAAVSVSIIGPPVNNMPSSPQVVAKGKTLTFSSAGGNAITVADPYAALLQVSLTVSHGTLTLGSVTGMTFVAGTGKNNATMTFRGTVAAINAALDGLTHTPASGYVGSDALTITSTDLTSRLSDTDDVMILVEQQKK